MRNLKIISILVLLSLSAAMHCASGDTKDEPITSSSDTNDKTLKEVNERLKKITIEFPHNSDKPEGSLFPEESLNKVRDLIKKSDIKFPEGYIIKVIGHATAVGDDAYNRNLAQRRAEYMVNWLIRRGFPREILKAANDGTRMNRRAVTFQIESK